MWTKIKRSLPAPIKNRLLPAYRLALTVLHKINPKPYQHMMDWELSRFNNEEEVNDLPDIFHYWSNKYLKPKFEAHGFSNPDAFFELYAEKAISSTSKHTHILSIGSGNCDTEVKLATDLKAHGHHTFTIHCMDINQVMFERGFELAKQNQIENHIKFITQDFNTWKTNQKYDLIIANQSLHHVVELEHLFEQIKLGLTENGYFITSDMIGRNGHMRWPEALKVLKPIWRKMPERYKFNHTLNRHEKRFINHDCSTQGFEGIRAQDILPLLQANFKFELFIPFANLVTVFIDRPFGPNFDVNNPDDLAFIDKIHYLDEHHFENGTYKPTQMLAAMKVNSNSTPVFGKMSPKFSIRPI